MVADPSLRPRTRRLIWRRLGPQHLDAFHALATDDHVRRFLLDGMVVDRAWCADETGTSAALFEQRGLGLWMLWLGDGLRDTGPDPLEPDAPPCPLSGPPVGFAGFKVFAEMGPAPQLIYAFTADFAGRGLATEAGRALIDVGYAAGLDPITAAVDGPNRASLQVLHKLGFTVVRTAAEGDFGETVYLARGRKDT